MPANLRPGQIAILAGGVVTLIFSFFAFIKSDFSDQSVNAWSGDGLSPLTIFPVLLCVIAAALVAAKVFGNANLPEPLAGFSHNQLSTAFGFTSTLILIGVALSLGSGTSAGFGLWLSLLGAIAVLVGGVMETQADGSAPRSGGGGATPPSPF